MHQSPAEGDLVRTGQAVAVLEAMKMEHVVTAAAGGIVRLVAVAQGDVLLPGQPVLFIEPRDGKAAQDAEAETQDPDAIRPDLADAIARHALTLDAARPEAVARRHGYGARTARENVEDLCDPASFMEYGALAVAGQRSRRSLEELLRISPADGVIAGVGTVNAGQFGESRGSTVIVAYDYSVLAGTQGTLGHKKQDRILNLTAELRRPLVLFAEGGGGRPGETDKAQLTSASLDIPTFHAFARLSGLVPLVGVVNGRCFAGNAALLGCCDVIIATESSSIGMGGLAMIEGGGLGVFRPEEVGPVTVQVPNGVIDLLVRDEREAVAAAKRYLSYFQGQVAEWSCADQRALRRMIPENRLRVYDVRAVIRGLADADSVLELRAGFGIGMVTALIRVEGRPMGLIANNPMHLGGAIDADAADRRPASCSSATGTTCRSCRSATRRASWWGRTPRRPRRSAGSAGCSWAARTSTCRSSRWSFARVMAWARRPWRPAASTRRCSTCPGRRASSGAWAWKGRCGSATATSWPPSPTRPSGTPSSAGTSMPCMRAARRPTWRRCWRWTT